MGRFFFIATYECVNQNDWNFIMPASFTESQKVRVEGNTRDDQIQTFHFTVGTVQVQKGKRRLQATQLVIGQPRAGSQGSTAQVLLKAFPSPFPMCQQWYLLLTLPCRLSPSPEGSPFIPGLEHCLPNALYSHPTMMTFTVSMNPQWASLAAQW